MTDLERRLALAIVQNHDYVDSVYGDRECMFCGGGEYRSHFSANVQLDPNDAPYQLYHEADCLVVECARLLGLLDVEEC